MLFLATAAGASACGPESAVAPGILLVSFDTTRADRIGAYGYDGADTPTVDALARDGIVFEQAIAPTPITLPSHATILTGQPPSVHGVRDNGLYVLSSRAELVSETLRDRGFRTGAFVAAFVLDSRFGLDQGFESYRGPRLDTRRQQLSGVQWRAAEVVDEAIDWLGGIRPEEKFFAWVHFFDPHHPYKPPKDFRSGARQIYDAEIAYADRELGRLLDFLDAQGRRPELTVVVTADHGEGLEEHGEESHGILVYQDTLHVPLVISGARVRGAAGSRVRTRVGLVDVAPTLLTLAGIPPDALESRGYSLVDARGAPVAPPRDRVIRIETLLPYHGFRWRALRGLLWRNYKLIEGAQLELYDLEKDPDERDNRAAFEPDLTRELGERLAAGQAALGWAETRSVDAEEGELLMALGYVGAGNEPEGDPFAPGLPDPRERVGDVAVVSEGERLLRRAMAPRTAKRGKRGELLIRARSLYEELRGRDPNNPHVPYGLGLAEFGLGNCALALPFLERAAELRPLQTTLFEALAQCYLAAGRFSDADAASAVAASLTEKASASD